VGGDRHDHAREYLDRLIAYQDNQGLPGTPRAHQGAAYECRPEFSQTGHLPSGRNPDDQFMQYLRFGNSPAVNTLPQTRSIINEFLLEIDNTAGSEEADMISSG